MSSFSTPTATKKNLPPPSDLLIYNSIEKARERFVPLQEGKVSMYVCGPTVYDRAHIGHAMSALVFDIVRRYLEFKGYTVEHVMNFTDVDDKIIAAAQKKGIEPSALANTYIVEFQEDLKSLNILTPTIMPRVSEEIEEIKTFISKLIEKNAAYQTADGNVYFDVSSDRAYSEEVSRMGIKPEEEVAVSLSKTSLKKQKADFALWKAAKEGEPKWKSPWGDGRPGWHIECSAMSLRYLGSTFDIHGGGIDLAHPHHRNERAQSEALTGQKMARYWMHNGMLEVGGKKMSKSDKEKLVTIRGVLEKHEPQVMRLLVLSSKYRSPLQYTDIILETQRRNLSRIREALKPVSTDGAPPEDTSIIVKKFEQHFIAAMDEDFNTPKALAALFGLVKTIETERNNPQSGWRVAALQKTLLHLSKVLGLDIASSPRTFESTDKPFVTSANVLSMVNEIRQFLNESTVGKAFLSGLTDYSFSDPTAVDEQEIISELINLQQRARVEKAFGIADKIRQALQTVGLEIQDKVKASDL